MGQTLNHGVYLPAEGERNCYDGLASNWSILDGAVGTIAEHTSALAGKAPLVHTHTVSQITDFPAYGNAAGTICEGNDSRLSDARTPVAHTHTKSDVTDLLNSNFIPSANNSYDLGSSSYQWNNLYAKNYYYNGTAWGLDQANVWSADQTYSTAIYGQMIWLKNTGLDLSVNGNTGLLGTYQHMIHWVDKNNAVYSSIQSWTGSSENTLVLRSKYRTDANTVRDLSVRFTSTATKKVVYPETNADTDLGTSTNKWKSFNGVNPGALSLPSSNYVAIDTTGWDLTGATYNRVYINNANPTFPGILFIRINSTTATDILVRLFTTSGQEISYVGSKMEAGSNNMAITVPCPPSTNIYVMINTSSSIYTCRYYTLLGDPEFDSRSGS